MGQQPPLSPMENFYRFHSNTELKLLDNYEEIVKQINANKQIRKKRNGKSLEAS